MMRREFSSHKSFYPSVLTVSRFGIRIKAIVSVELTPCAYADPDATSAAL
jgi:hypothetical protein